MNAARSRMVYRATLQRPIVGAVDADGHPTYNGWQVLTAVLPIYLWEVSSQEAFSLNQVAVLIEVRAIVPKNTDITVGDRINGIKLRSNAVWSSQIFRVEAVVRRGISHKELNLKVVSS